MKKSLFFSMIIALGLLIGAIWGITEIRKQKEAVQIYAQTLEGDVTEAEGISFQIHTNWADQLYWDTKVTVAGVKEGLVDTETVFRADWKPGASRSRRYEPFTHAQGEVELHFESGTFMYNDIVVDDAFAIPYKKAVIDVAKRAVGEMPYTEVVKVSDYYEYYNNLWIDVYTKESQIWDVEDNYIDEFLGIEVPDEHELEITVAPKEGWKISTVRIETASDGAPYHFISSSCKTKDGIFFAFHCVDDQGNMINLKSKPGNGILFLPLQTVEENRVKVMASDIQKVFSLPSEDCWVLELQIDENQEHLYILTREKEQMVLRVVDAASMEELQSLALADLSGKATIKQMDQLDDALFVLLTDGTFHYLIKETNGNFQKKISGTLGAGSQLQYSSESPLHYDLNYQDEKLALLCEESIYKSSAYLYVFSEDTLLYKAYYLHSADYESNYHDQVTLNEINSLILN